MKEPKQAVENLIKAKVSVEKNIWYQYFTEEVTKQLKSIQEHIGTMRTGTLDEMRFEQGKIDALGWILRRPDKLMNELINTLKE